MDIESLKSLGTLVFWGALFYLMMRYGCGAHMMGGRGHGNHAGHAGSGGGKDPVRGMDVDPKQSAGASVHGGNAYYFRSTACRDKFEKDPEKYAAAPTRDAHQHARHCQS